MDYPVWNVAMGGGMLMAWVAVTHVIVSHFAVGGGLLIVVTETLAVKRGDREFRELARRSSLVLVLFSTVFGAISGVGIWVVAGLISPAAISALIHAYVWAWAIEWVFFIVEIVAALVYYSTWGRITKGAHLLVGWLYVAGAYGSLVVINGIITFMLTPGGWLEDHRFWTGFFNPTYWPSTVLRTGIALMMAAVFMVFAALRGRQEARPRMLRYLGLWLAAGTLLAYGGYRWWEARLPEGVRGLFLGARPALESLATTRHLTLWALALSLLAAVVLLVGLPRAVNVVTGALIMAVAFASFAGYERLREGCRKPFIIHDYMFSNGLLVSHIPKVNKEGVLAVSGWAARLAGSEPTAVGRQVFRVQCASCHTVDGYLSIRKLLPTVPALAAVAGADRAAAGKVFEARCRGCHGESSAAEMQEALPSPEEMAEDPEMMRDLVAGMVSGTLEKLKDQGEVFVEAGGTRPVDISALEYPFMPPFVGTDEEMDALSRYLVSLQPAAPAPAAEGGAS